MHVKCQEISNCTISKGVLLNMPILTDKQILRPYGSVYYTEDIFWETVNPIVPFKKIETILMGVNKYNNVGLCHVVVRNTDILSNGRVSFSFNLVNPVSISTYASIQVHIIGRWK